MFGRVTSPAAPVLRLRLQAAAALLLVAALLAAALSAFATARTDLHRLATGSQPRAAAAADLHRTLADLDAQHANALVVGYASTPAPGGAGPVLVDDGVLAALTAQADRRRVARDLALLAPSSSAEVQDVIDALGSYDALSGTEEFQATTQNAPVVGVAPVLALNYYAQAAGVLQQQLLPRVRALLDSANAQVAADRAAATGDARRGAALLAVLGALALALLLWWQADLARRHRRVLNPALLLATAAVLAVALGGGLGLLSAAGHVDDAVSRGHGPFAAVAGAQVAAADAEAAESRWLVDDAYRPSLQSSFDGLAGQLRALSPDAAGSPELTPAVERTRTAYLAADAQLRQLARQGQLDQASVQLTGVTRGQLAFAYYDFGLQLDRLSAAADARFTAGAAAADGDLAPWSWAPSALLGPALLLIVLGVRPRLAEFG